MTDEHRSARPDPSSSNWSSWQSLVAVFRNTGRVPADPAALRDVVRAYVDVERRRGEPAECVIIDLKEAMRAAGVIQDYRDSRERTLAESVIRWCIEQYYQPGCGTDSTPT